ncbi:hypothetical protein [Aureimonas pseudogalii]|uniref:Uncharacterized protein n=1 Tax=Aureimonas pseudogalii TaxID=1744844 RepID=A0A7W6E991_9HYPH|nr:hypothetical protein [Aureimonas pseudogalii]MBB3997102.1 hypothetical protein [Aureimonas pseudogalii]
MSDGAGGITRRGFMVGAATLAALPGPARAVPSIQHRRVLLLPQALADHAALAGLVARDQATEAGQPLAIAAAMPPAFRYGPTLTLVSPASLLAVPPAMLLRLVLAAPLGIAAAVVAAPAPARSAPGLPALAEALGRLLAEREAPATTIWVHADGARARGAEATERTILDGLRTGLGEASAGVEVLTVALGPGEPAGAVPTLRAMPLA